MARGIKLSDSISISELMHMREVMLEALKKLNGKEAIYND